MIKKSWKNKIIATLILSIFVLMSNFSITTVLANNDVYEKHYQADLSTLNISLENDTIKVSKKDVPIAKKLKQNREADVFEKEILTNKRFLEDLKTMIENGKTPIAIGVAEAEILVTLDDQGNVATSRPLTNKEVAKANNSNAVYAVNGQTQYRDTLSLYTSVSGSSPNYWVQSNSYWSSGEISDGREALGVTWEDDFGADNNTATSVSFGLSGSEGASLSDFEPYRGAVWNFHDGEYWDHAINYLNGAYVGAGITRYGNYGLHYFTSEYIHTYTSTTWAASVELDGSGLSGASVQINPSTNTWKLVSYLGGNF